MADRWLYQAKAEPPAAAVQAATPVTLDRWFQPTAVPVRPPARTHEGSVKSEPPPGQLAAQPVSVASWYQPLAVPVLPRRHAHEGSVKAEPPWSAIAPANPSGINLDHWYQPPPGPRLDRARLQFGTESVGPIEPILPPPIPDSATWYQPLQEPLRPRPHTHTGFTVEPLEQSLHADRVPSLATWFRQQPGPWPRPLPAREGFYIQPPGGALFAPPRPGAILQRFVYTLGMLCRETISGAGHSSAVVKTPGFTQATRRYSPTTDPPCSRASYSTQTIGGGGTVEVDGRALPGTQAPLDGRGKSLRYLFLRNRGTGSVRFETAAANPLELFGAGNQPQFPAGATVSLFLPAGVPLTPTAYAIKLAGTAADQSDLALILG